MTDLTQGRQMHKGVSLCVKLVIVALSLVQLACSAVTGPVVTSPAATMTPAAETDSNATATLRPAADIESGRKQSVMVPGLTCIGAFGHGLACIEAGEWVTYTSENSALGSDQIKDIAVCDDGRMVILHTHGLNVFDGKRWESYESGWGSSSVAAVACDARGRFWVAHYQGASYFNGASWETYDALGYLSTGPDASDLVHDVAIAPDGTVWVVTSSSVAAFDGNAWTVYQEGEGFYDRNFFDKIAIDRYGQPWVTSSLGLFNFDGLFWTLHASDHMWSVKALAIDAQNRVWVGTFSHGVLIFDGSGWIEYNVENSSLVSDRLQTIVMDAGGRVWLGTQWGLHVIENGEWLIFQMHTAGLVDNDIYAMGVAGDGPDLPPLSEMATGSITGRIVDKGGVPVAGASVEMCVEMIFSNFYGETPCRGQPYVRVVETDADGTFIFNEVPRGFYVFAIYAGDAWTLYLSDFGVAAKRVPVRPGENTYVGELMLGEE